MSADQVSFGQVFDVGRGSQLTGLNVGFLPASSHQRLEAPILSQLTIDGHTEAMSDLDSAWSAIGTRSKETHA